MSKEGPPIKRLLETVAVLCFGTWMDVVTAASIGLFFPSGWRTDVFFTMCAVGAVPAGLYIYKFIDRRETIRQLDTQITEATDEYLIHTEAILLRGERFITEIGNLGALTDDGHRLLAVIRSMGRLEGAIGAYHRAAAGGIDRDATNALMQAIDARLHEVAKATGTTDSEEEE
jgi:hypothetical protein